MSRMDDEETKRSNLALCIMNRSRVRPIGVMLGLATIVTSEKVAVI